GGSRSVYVIGIEWSGTCNILVGSSDGRVKAAELVRGVCKAFNGKGGGDEKIAVGSFPCDAYIRAVEEAERIVLKLLGS
ncbi:MAG: hypothetical protein QW334_03495, partial [Thermofilum sp.]